MYCSLAPNSTLLARFCTTFAMRSRPRRISLVGTDEMRPSESGATMAGQKNLRKMKAPTVVNLASGNRRVTAVAIVWQIRRNVAGMRAADLQMPSMKIWVTACNCNAFR